jgi:hypothetical protein
MVATKTVFHIISDRFAIEVSILVSDEYGALELIKRRVIGHLVESSRKNACHYSAYITTSSLINLLSIGCSKNPGTFRSSAIILITSLLF